MLNYRVQISLLVVGLLIGLITVAHFKESFASPYANSEITDRAMIVETLLSEQTLFKSQILALRERIDQIQANLKSGKTKTDLIEYLKLLKDEIGLSMMSGEGIIIRLDDSRFVQRELLDVNNASLVHAADLRDIVNVLKASKVDAIAINDQRVLALTPISCVGNSILVNSSHLLPPFKISAIGDPEILVNNLQHESMLEELWKRVHENAIVFETETVRKLQIPVYNGDFPMKYIN